ncbi:MAG: protein-tyrosine-phosphatase [Alteromonadaceae bacterium]|jgi:protein-tyrosine-phosphatase
MKNPSGAAPVAISIWLLAFGYFAFYIPYSALIKALSSNYLLDYGVSGGQGTLAAAAFLPIVLLGTVITMPVILYCLGWYRYLGENNRRSARHNGSVFHINRWSIFSGLAFAVIIATTTLAYSFVGVSIVFALLLMRGGVLVMSPLVDRFFKREVHWYSWAGLGLSLVAVGIALSQVDEYRLDWIVLLNLAGYLTGYFFRLRQMTHYAKDAQEALNRQFLVAENTVAMAALVVIALATLAFHLTTSQISVAAYVTTMVSSGVIWVALLIGMFYGVLGIFGSLIYLNRRENTFSIPVNRCASLLSGVFASFVLVFLFDGQSISVVQLVSALSISAALFLMSIFDSRQIHQYHHSVENPMQRIWLFICDGNRMRSPMAAAICNKVLENHFEALSDDENDRDVYADSAAIKVGKNRDMPDAARHALAEFDISIDQHQARQVSETQLHQAEKIYCMSVEQCDALIEVFPWTASKVVNLAGEMEISKPAGPDKTHFLDLANILHQYIEPLITALGSDEGAGIGITLEQNNA